MTLLDMVTSELFSYGVTTLENHESKWTQDEEVSRLDCAVERGKYKNYKNLTSPVDREKYGPKERRYTMGKGQKRIFGETAWSKDGQESICRVREMYDTMLDDDEAWGWMLKGWEKYSEKRELFCHYKRKEVTDVLGGNSDEEEEEGGELELVLDGEDGFRANRTRDWQARQERATPAAAAEKTGGPPQAHDVVTPSLPDLPDQSRVTPRRRPGGDKAN